MRTYFRLALLVLISVSASAQLPIVSIVPTSTAYCTGRPVTFSASVQGTVDTYSWTVFPTKDVKSGATNENIFTATFPKDLSYTVTVIASNITGSVSARRIVPVAMNARASFNASLMSTGFPNEMVLTNYSSFSSKNYWLYSDDAVRDSSRNTVKSYSAPGLYGITLVALGTRGCHDTLFYSFPIESSSSLTLPNVFTPNGDDVNDIYKPISTGISSMKGFVFTREGIPLYQWTTPNGYWDGRTNSGEACQDGEYVVVVEAIGFDGKSYNLSSMITLIR